MTHFHVHISISTISSSSGGGTSGSNVVIATGTTATGTGTATGTAIAVDRYHEFTHLGEGHVGSNVTNELHAKCGTTTEITRAMLFILFLWFIIRMIELCPHELLLLLFTTTTTRLTLTTHAITPTIVVIVTG